MPSLQKTTKNNDIFRGFLCYWSYFFALLSPYMKGFINYVRISVSSLHKISDSPLTFLAFYGLTALAFSPTIKLDERKYRSCCQKWYRYCGKKLEG